MHCCGHRFSVILTIQCDFDHCPVKKAHGIFWISIDHMFDGNVWKGKHFESIRVITGQQNSQHQRRPNSEPDSNQINSSAIRTHPSLSKPPRQMRTFPMFGFGSDRYWYARGLVGIGARNHLSSELCWSVITDQSRLNISKPFVFDSTFFGLFSALQISLLLLHHF